MVTRKLVAPVAVAVHEDTTQRHPGIGPFGVRGTDWATVLGVTIADSNQIVTGRGWNRGAGEWKVPRGKHPLPVGITLLLLVRSPTSTWTPEHFRSPSHGVRELVLEEWDLKRAFEWVQQQVLAIGLVSGDQLLEALMPHFWVDDPDDDGWVDVPIVD